MHQIGTIPTAQVNVTTLSCHKYSFAPLLFSNKCHFVITETSLYIVICDVFPSDIKMKTHYDFHVPVIRSVHCEVMMYVAVKGVTK